MTRKKNNPGIIVFIVWMTEGVTREYNFEAFIEIVEIRNSEPVHEVILRNVESGTKIITDSWRYYIIRIV